MRRLAGVLAAAAVVLTACAPSASERLYRIPSSAMEPTLHCAKPAAGCTASENDTIRVRVTSRPKRGDIVAFRVPPAGATACSFGGGDNLVFVKRVIGLPGETWAERKGYLYIDGRRLREPYIKANRRDSDTIPSRRIPAGNYVVLGDNRMSSCDSRRWGYVPRKNIIGRAVKIIRGDKTIDLE